MLEVVVEVLKLLVELVVLVEVEMVLQLVHQE